MASSDNHIDVLSNLRSRKGFGTPSAHSSEFLDSLLKRNGDSPSESSEHPKGCGFGGGACPPTPGSVSGKVLEKRLGNDLSKSDQRPKGRGFGGGVCSHSRGLGRGR